MIILQNRIEGKRFEDLLHEWQIHKVTMIPANDMTGCSKT